MELKGGVTVKPGKDACPVKMMSWTFQPLGASISHLKQISVPQNGGLEWELLKPINSSLGIIGSEMVVEYGDIWGYVYYFHLPSNIPTIHGRMLPLHWLNRDPCFMVVE